VVVLTDGRRLRCPPSSANSVSSPSVLTRSCAHLTPLAVAANIRAVATAIASTRACLTARHRSFTGGPTMPPDPYSGDQPDGELTLGEDKTVGFIAFYRDERRARRLEPKLASNAKRIEGEVERHGAVTLVWSHPPSDALRADMRACASG